MYTPSMLRNMVSSSLGGRFERDQAEATRCGEELIRECRALTGNRNYPDDPRQLVDIVLLSIDEVDERVALFLLVLRIRRGKRGTGRRRAGRERGCRRLRIGQVRPFQGAPEPNEP